MENETQGQQIERLAAENALLRASIKGKRVTAESLDTHGSSFAEGTIFWAIDYAFKHPGAMLSHKGRMAPKEWILYANPSLYGLKLITGHGDAYWFTQEDYEATNWEVISLTPSAT